MEVTDHSAPAIERRLGARILPLLLVAMLVAPLLAGSDTTPLLSLLAGSIAVVVLGVSALVEPRAGRTLSPLVTATLLSSFLLATWLTARALLSASPHVSFLGTMGQHSGAALWIVAAGWLAGAALVADKRALRDMLGVVAVFGALYAVLGIVEAAGGTGREWGSAAGPFENSSSLGSFLAIAAFAAFAWGRTWRDRAARFAANAVAAVCVLGIWAADSRTGLAGIAIGLAVLGLLYVGKRSQTRTWMVATGVPLAGLAVTAVLALGATGRLGPVVLRAIASIGTQRDTIWNSAVAQVVASPFAGRGPELFSAWISWSFDGGVLSFNGTYDPHHALLGLALGGGLVAVTLALVAATAGLAASVNVFEDARRALPVASIAALPAALAGASLFTWLTPAAVFAAAAVLGALLASARASDARVADSRLARQLRIGMGATLMLGCAATIAVAVIALPTQRAFSSLEDVDLNGAVALYQSWPDPAYASRAADAAVISGLDPSMLDRILGDVDSMAEHHVDLALRQIFLGQRALTVDSARWPEFAEAVERGMRADPASGIWYTLAAAQADALGRHESSADYAERALGFALTPEDRVYLEGLAGR
ncbi:MAG: O-antigen ligase family protein [Coriobacteriia bacterium]|nr:O-antigen ligase family protein [Coriobacteriia bacterium]